MHLSPDSDDRIRDPKGIIALFNHNIALEHGAIVQYLQHAYAMGEGGVGCEVINIARDEMRHLKYFADLIVDLGGVPALDRGLMILEADSAAQMMVNGQRAEDEAIATYARQIELIDHPPAQRILERILRDEELHHGMFRGFEAELQGADPLSFPLGGLAADPELISMLNEDFAREYNKILEYLRYYFTNRHGRTRDYMQEAWIWHMKHMAWIADEINEEGGAPEFALNPTFHDVELREKVARAIAIEQEHQGAYERRLGCPLSPELKAKFKTILHHEQFNEHKLTQLYEALAPQPTPQVKHAEESVEPVEPTIEPIAAGTPDDPTIESAGAEQPAEPSPEPLVESTPEAAEAVQPTETVRPTGLTVGSLLGEI